MPGVSQSRPRPITEVAASVGLAPQEVTVSEVWISAGDGLLVPITGEILTMPGLPRVPNVERIDVDAAGRITGLV